MKVTLCPMLEDEKIELSCKMTKCLRMSKFVKPERILNSLLMSAAAGSTIPAKF